MKRKSDRQEDPLRHHEFDGIQEYDKRLPNWWLWTWYGAMIFSFGYWLYFHQSAIAMPADQKLQAQLAELTMRAAEKSGKELDDPQLWAMSRDSASVAAGAEIFKANCVSCHGANLQGGIGANLTDQEWIHGGKPTEVVHTITTGVAAKGMPTWGPVLGRRRITEVAAFVLSHHKEGEPITLKKP